MRPSSNNNFSSSSYNNELELYSVLYRLDDIRQFSNNNYYFLTSASFNNNASKL